MRYSADLFFDEGRLFDIRVVGTLALTQDDADAIRAVEGVEEMMPAYSADAVVNTSGGDTLVTRFHSLWAISIGWKLWKGACPCAITNVLLC